MLFLPFYIHVEDILISLLQSPRGICKRKQCKERVVLKLVTWLWSGNSSAKSVHTEYAPGSSRRVHLFSQYKDSAGWRLTRHFLVNVLCRAKSLPSLSHRWYLVIRLISHSFDTSPFTSWRWKFQYLILNKRHLTYVVMYVMCIYIHIFWIFICMELLRAKRIYIEISKYNMYYVNYNVFDNWKYLFKRRIVWI